MVVLHMAGEHTTTELAQLFGVIRSPCTPGSCGER